MNALKSFFALALLITTCVNFSDAYCSTNFNEWNTCLHTFPNGTVGRYSPGESWKPAPCQVCNCRVAKYEDYFTCFMPLQPGYQIANNVVPIFKIQLANYPPTECPPGLQSILKKGIFDQAQFYLTYQAVSSVSSGCCDNTESLSEIIPEFCKSVRYGENLCQVKAVLKEDESRLCPTNLAIKGK